MSKLQSMPVDTIVYIENINLFIKITPFVEDRANCSNCIKGRLRKSPCQRVDPQKMKDCLGKYRYDNISVIFTQFIPSTKEKYETIKSFDE